MFIGELINVYEAIIGGAVNSVNWLFNPIDSIGVSPVMLITGGGLIAYLVVAIVKWVIS